MSAPRFHCPEPLQAGQTIVLPQDIAHHAVRVLRLRPGAVLHLFDGQGGEYPATLEMQGKTALAQIGPHDPREAELDAPITLLQGIPGGSKMDWVIEKAVEMGVQTLVPVMARRSQPQPDGPRLEKRLQHWERIVRSASEQCGRNRLMHIAAPATLAACLSQRQPADGTLLLCHPEGERTLAEALPAKGEALALAVGPEGGWSDEERQAMLAAGAMQIRFGPRVLRTETAGIALVAAASALLGLA